MTAQLDIEYRQKSDEGKIRINYFDTSLAMGWILTPDEHRMVVEEFHTIVIGPVPIHIPFGGPKVLTPKRAKDMTDEERAQQKAEIDEINARRTQKALDGLMEHFSEPVARILLRRMKPHITGVALVHAPKDKWFTLIPEYDLLPASTFPQPAKTAESEASDSAA